LERRGIILLLLLLRNPGSIAGGMATIVVEGRTPLME